MYPIGFASIAEYLERAGYRVRIVNLAVRMMKDKNFDAGVFIKRPSWVESDIWWAFLLLLLSGTNGVS